MSIEDFISQRVDNLLNALPQTAVEAESMGIFKVKVDSLLISQGIKGYGEKAGIWG